MQDETATWVVYLRTIRKGREGMKAVCLQCEWDALELARPGYHHLIRASIANEAEAELLARNDPPPPTYAATWPRLRR